MDVIYDASYIDDEGMDMLEKKKKKHIVAPRLKWLKLYQILLCSRLG